MTQNPFAAIGIPILILWTLALIGYLPVVHKRTRYILSTLPLLAGWFMVASYLAGQWQLLGHPPMRTIGQTMLWAAFFLPPVTLGMEWFRRTRTQAIPTIVIGLAFIIGVLVMNEAPSKELMPALQSPWFAPHVLIYMLSYAIMAVAGLMGIWYLCASFIPKCMPDEGVLNDLRLLVRIAFPLLTAGMLLGAYWAKIAWGHYWGWDPKETAAFVTWAAYLIYVHLDYRTKLSPRLHLGLVSGAALTVVFCWLLINVLPSAQSSVHVYSK
jgi:ABC-type transport system involved in cytochrome c biogenesis permease subunit